MGKKKKKKKQAATEYRDQINWDIQTDLVRSEKVDMYFSSDKIIRSGSILYKKTIWEGH